MSLDAAFSSFPVLCTHRFHLRRIQPSDAEAFFRIKSDPEVTVSYGREPHRSLQDTQAWVRSSADKEVAEMGPDRLKVRGCSALTGDRLGRTLSP